jgi:hypothetical protein
MRTLLALAAAALLVTLALAEPLARAKAADQMVGAAVSFTGALTPEQRGRATFAFEDQERFDWHFIPRARKGMPIGELSPAQQETARGLLRAGLGQRGYLKATTIFELELVLREMGGNPDVRDPGKYYFSIFGTPSAAGTWGWRVEGHHLSLNFTVVKGIVSSTPSFFGANPAEVRQGTRRGLRTLAAEEDLARELLTSLDADQRAAAVYTTDAPRDIVTANSRRADPLSPPGLPASRLRPPQQALLTRLIEEYLARMPDDLAAERFRAISSGGIDKITFAWAGSAEPGQPHYYRVQGPTFLVEYDNTQNDANHIHSVWRDFTGDFGRDLLTEHYLAVAHE